MSVAVGVAVIASSTSHASSWHNKVDTVIGQKLTQKSTGGWTSVIVRFDKNRRAGSENLLKRLNADIYRDLSVINGAALRVPTRNLEKLASLKGIERVSWDGGITKNDEYTVSSSGADIAWMAPFEVTGKGVTVAVLDSGVSNHPDFKRKKENFRNSNAKDFEDDVLLESVAFGMKESKDECGHGTHVAGIISGTATNSTGPKFRKSFRGIAPEADIVSVRVLDANGGGVVSNVISGINWVIQNRATYKIKVLNISLGHPVGESYTTDPLCLAVTEAWKAGIVVVCAAGNSGRLNEVANDGMSNEGWGTAYGSIQVPGNTPCVITVGAMKGIPGERENDKIATYSSRGPTRLDLVLKPDIVAAGNRIVSLAGKGCLLSDKHSTTNLIPESAYMVDNKSSMSDRYFMLSGTSMASPVVAGAVALMLQADKTLSPDTIKARLMVSATKWTGEDGKGDPCTYGAGYLNIPAALSSNLVARSTALSPTLSQDSSGNVFIDMERAVWGTGIDNLRAVWGHGALVGDSARLAASRAVWGNAVWFDRAVWGVGTNRADLSMKAIAGEAP